MSIELVASITLVWVGGYLVGFHLGRKSGKAAQEEAITSGLRDILATIPPEDLPFVIEKIFQACEDLHLQEK